MGFFKSRSPFRHLTAEEIAFEKMLAEKLRAIFFAPDNYAQLKEICGRWDAFARSPQHADVKERFNFLKENGPTDLQFIAECIAAAFGVDAGDVRFSNKRHHYYNVLTRKININIVYAGMDENIGCDRLAKLTGVVAHELRHKRQFLVEKRSLGMEKFLSIAPMCLAFWSLSFCLAGIFLNPSFLYIAKGCASGYLGMGLVMGGLHYWKTRSKYQSLSSFVFPGHFLTLAQTLERQARQSQISCVTSSNSPFRCLLRSFDPPGPIKVKRGCSKIFSERANIGISDVYREVRVFRVKLGLIVSPRER